jgi:hypothetical protein
MEKIMNSSLMKTIVVQLSEDNFQEFDIDTSIFEDPFLEAATRAIESIKKQKHGMILAVINCWEKDVPQNLVMYNSYWVLVNAACYKKAELLREKFKLQTDCDLAKEPKSGTKKYRRKK